MEFLNDLGFSIQYLSCYAIVHHSVHALNDFDISYYEARLVENFNQHLVLAIDVVSQVVHIQVGPEIRVHSHDQ